MNLMMLQLLWRSQQNSAGTSLLQSFNLGEASSFFEADQSVIRNRDQGRLDGLKLATKEWRVELSRLTESTRVISDESKIPKRDC